MEMKKLFTCLTVLLTHMTGGFAKSAPDTVVLTLDEVVSMAKSRSIDSRQAATVRETRYWEWRTYKSNYQPQLSLQGILPGYSKTFAEVLQPNGSVDFRAVRNNNSSLNLSFSQRIAETGGTVFGTTQMQRFDDYDRNSVLYNGVPYALGYSQPLFQFNKLKWDRQVEGLKYEESKSAFTESMEKIAMNASEYFFDLLLAQVNLEIAETNLANTDNILKVAGMKLELGRITRNEILQLKLEQVKAQKAVGIAKRDMEIATLNLRSYTGISGTGKIALKAPGTAIAIKVPADKVLAEAYANRSDAIAFGRRIAEARRDVAKARGENGLNATLTARLGFSKSSTKMMQVYHSPQNQQLLQLELDIPIMDWGRSKSRTRTAEASQKFTEYAVEQDKQNFTQEIITQVTLFDMMQNQLVLAADADRIASEKYQIARDRYLLGNLSITDLSIAFQEKDQAKRDYIYALRDLWGAFYQLRFLSLYDFEKSQKISY